MRELHVVATSEDGRHVVLATRKGAASGDYRVALDERLTAAVRGDLPRPGEAEPADISPKEIQARLRAGESPEQIAASAGVPVAKVDRYAGPVLSERERVLSQARAGFVSRSRLGASAVPLGEAVDKHLAETVGVRPETVTWSARREEAGTWVVELSYVSQAKRRSAAWRYDMSSREVTATDAPSAALAHVEPGGRRSKGEEHFVPAQSAASRPARPAARRARPASAPAARTVAARPAPPVRAAAPVPRSAAPARAAQMVVDRQAAAQAARAVTARAAAQERAATAAAAKAAREAAAAEQAAAAQARASAARTAKEAADRTADAARRAQAAADKAAAEKKAKAEAARQAKLAAEKKAKAEAARQAKLAAEKKAKAEAARQAKLAAEKKAKAEAARQAKLAAEKKAQAQAARQAKAAAEKAAEKKAQAEAARRAKAAAEKKAQAQAARQAKAAAEKKAKAVAERAAKKAAQKKAAEKAAAEAAEAARVDPTPAGPPTLRVVGSDAPARRTPKEPPAAARSTPARAAGQRASVPGWADVLLSTAPVARSSEPEPDED